MFDKVLKDLEELDKVNNDIINAQKAHIEELVKHIEELHAIIKKYLLKDIKDESSIPPLNIFS